MLGVLAAAEEGFLRYDFLGLDGMRWYGVGGALG